ncbi:MAG: hypothetical protein RLP44_27085 [Aggregatilineales bacterium]
MSLKYPLNRLLMGLILISFGTALTFIISAQTSDNELTRFETEQGNISRIGESQIWTFEALADEALSIIIEPTVPFFDSVLQIIDENGRTILRADDFAYPDDTNANVEAITIPRSGTYEVVVSGYGNSTGSYRITLLPGYGEQAQRQTFEGTNSWQAQTDDLGLTVSDGVLNLSLEGVQVRGLAGSSSVNTFNDFYAQVDYVSIVGRNGWEVGLSLRRQSDTDTFYQYSVNSQGLWRFLAVEDGVERLIRDYTPHPAIVGGETSFTLGVLANSAGFDVFYNGQFMGQVVDTAISDGGGVGVVIQTANAVGSTLTAQLDNFGITQPRLLQGERVMPQSIVLGTPRQIIQELERRGVIQPGGNLPLNVPESFADSRTPGIAQVALGRGATYTNFVIGTTATLTQNLRPDLAGCGLLFRLTGDTNYMVAYVDNANGYGVSERDGESFEAGIYGESETWITETANTMIVAVNAGTLHYYVNGNYAGAMPLEPLMGQVGNVLINFEPAESTCAFTDTWLWNLGE